MKEIDKLVEQGEILSAYYQIKRFENENFQYMLLDSYSIELMKYSCLLIDIGGFIHNKEMCLKGYFLISENQTKLTNLYTESSIEYNLGNAKKCEFDFDRKEIGFIFNINSIMPCLEAIGHYQKAFKNLPTDCDLDFKSQLLINLANSLNVIGRNSEAMIFYNQVLSFYPEKYEANANKAIALRWFNLLSGGYSISLFADIYYYATLAQKSKPAYHNDEYLVEIMTDAKLSIEKMNYDINILLTERKYHRLIDSISEKNPEICLFSEKELFLSEHSIYCNCPASYKDDIFYFNSRKFNKNFDLYSKLMLKRIKSEYLYARKLLFKYLYKTESTIESHESLRVSYRLCYGIFDKIAVSLVKYFNLKTKGNIYFETFWHQDEVKNNLSSIHDFNLLALYSIAYDLSGKFGQLNYFKIWRNYFEHNLVIINSSKTAQTSLIENEILYLNKEKFVSNLISLLQIARSAIFSFTFLMRENFDLHKT
ncbi:hypothetical protein LFX15_18605 [Leptospira levettii]|uniref:LA2681 family HEPN domain-containing protein n=1 Tax=Leptospira levettii TaxID=2023178 RepID=UPI001EEC3581|nr:LA2681 family HEPN domain-containing protein [Leptospira levettii]MCG6150315.1 hypothetical protein [Leptospira levettii]